MGRQLQASEDGGLFSLELSGHGSSAFLRGKETGLGDSPGTAGINGAKLVSFCAPATMFEYKLLEALRRSKPASVVASELNHHFLAKLLAAKGYTLSVHAPTPQCVCKSNGRKCLEVLSHTYLVCTGTDDYPSEEEIVVEPKLREQFEIAHPTEGYRKLLQDVPAEFVGSREKLKVVVEAISAAMAEAFQAQELPLPPWRRTAAALSKWDLDVAATGRSPSRSPEVRPALQPAWQLDKQFGAAGQQRFGFPDNQAAGSSSRAVQETLQRISGERGSCKPVSGPHRAQKPAVSLLARGLADMAVVQKGKRPLEGGKAGAKIKRVPSWDSSGLAPITTVRRSGRVK